MKIYSSLNKIEKEILEILKHKTTYIVPTPPHSLDIKTKKAIIKLVNMKIIELLPGCSFTYKMK